MKFQKILLSGLVVLCVLLTCGDSCVVAPTPGGQNGGFPVTTQAQGVDWDGNPVTNPYPEAGQYVTGIWIQNDKGAAGSVQNFAVTTDDNGNAFVNNGVVYADWNSFVYWNPACNGDSYDSADFINVNPLIGINWLCLVYYGSEGPNASTHFVLPGSVPPTITSYGGFSTTYGDPVLRVYAGGTTPGLASTVTASSVVPGSSATFEFPTQSNGSPLPEGFYALVNTNVASGGNLVSVNSSYLAVGGITSLSGAYGVDAADIVNSEQDCTDKYGCTRVEPLPTTTSPILTTYYSNQVVGWFSNSLISVGAEPVAVKAYGSYTYSYETSTHNGYIEHYETGPANAIVANSGSSSVSIVSFSTNTDVANIAVGAQPMAIALNSAATMAYVASYGNGTLAEVNLSTKAVTRTATGLAGAESVAMDPSGSYVWVGGANYLYKVSLSTFTVTGSHPVSGQVTSLAASNAQNELVYTLVQNCCSASSQYSANELSLSTMTSPGAYASGSASAYAPYTMNGTLPSAATLPQATVVSAQFSNGMAASATPTGFVIYDVEGHQQIMTGTTPTPVRGIAADPNCMFAYFTLPDSNEYIAVPLESAP